MPEPTNEELRQACERLRSSIYTDVQNVVSALLSRLDREAEAERQSGDMAALIAYIRSKQAKAHPLPWFLYGPPQSGDFEKDNASAIFAVSVANLFPALANALERSELLLKVAREAIESAAHAINCDYLSPIHTVCGHPANSRKHAGACDADWMPPAELKQRDCNCWKARALAEIAPAAPEGMP